MDRSSTPAEIAGDDKARGIPDTRLRGPWLVLARAAWILVVAISLAVSIADIPLEFARLHTVCVGSSCGQQLTAGIVQDLQHLNMSVDFFAAFNVVLEFGSLLVWVMVALVIFWRRSDDRMALLLGLFLVLFPAAQTGAAGTPDAVGAAYPSLFVLTNILDALSYLSLLLFFYLFPDGRFIPRWTRVVVVVYILLNAPGILIARLPFSNVVSSFLGLPLLTAVVGIGLVAQVYRYRRISSPAQRQQTKWAVYGSVTTVLLFIILVFLGHVLNPTPHLVPVLLINTAFHICELLIPFAIGFSILRHRLYDIDIVINRTLVYGALTALLALVYFGLIFALQSLLSGIISSNNSVAIVVSTLVIAALFQPLRSRIQRVIDRRFYRRKYDAARTLAAFSATLRSEVELNTLCDHLLSVVQETMQPASVSLWLPPVGKDGKRREEKLNETSEVGGGYL